MLVGVSGRCPDWRVQGESHPLLMEDFVLSHVEPTTTEAWRVVIVGYMMSKLICRSHPYHIPHCG